MRGRLALGAVGAAGVLMTAGGDSGPGICVVRHITGGYCPGCGGTRAATHLLGGEVSAAWRDHPWVVLALGQAVVLAGVVAVVLLVSRLKREPDQVSPDRFSSGRMQPPTVAATAGTATAAVPWTLLAVANVAALLVVWVVRLSLGQIPAPF